MDFFGARGARARALAARARMFVTSRVSFVPNQLYKAVCTLIYMPPREGKLSNPRVRAAWAACAMRWLRTDQVYSTDFSTY